VSAACWLWIASLVVGLVGTVVAFLTLGDAVRAQVRRQVEADPQLNAIDVETIVRIGSIVGAVVGLTIVALEVFFVLKMRAGRNWARITLTALGALSVAATVVGLGSATAFSAVFGLVQSALIVAAVVLMFTGAALDFFARR